MDSLLPALFYWFLLPREEGRLGMLLTIYGGGGGGGWEDGWEDV